MSALLLRIPAWLRPLVATAASLAVAVAVVAAAAATDAPGERLPALPLPPEAAEALALEGDVAAGATSFERCAVCHGAHAEGRPDGTFPILAGQHPSVIVKQVVDMREGRRRNPVMEPHARMLVGPRELADVVAYIATLEPPGENGTGPGIDLETGARLYRRDCVVCHGARGQGDAARAIPALVPQHYGYLVRQLRAIAGARMRDAHVEMLRTVEAYRDAELEAVADHVSRLRRGSPPPQGQEPEEAD